MSNNIPTTAVQRALQMPEILSAIFMWISLDRVGHWDFHDYEYDSDGNWDEDEFSPGYGQKGVLARCGVVNKLWHLEAMRYLWMDPTLSFFTQNSLPKYFFNLDAERRQYYANFVETAVLVTVREGDSAAKCDAALHGVTFPNLKSLEMILADNYVPRIENHRVKSLNINPRFEYFPEMYGMTRAEMGGILEQIITIFPDLEEVHFIDRAQVKLGALEHFREHLPSLRSFDHSCVRESSEDF